ncbi:HEAT repeat domain-containing protein [Salinispira pacifica]|uniref:HEAT repeat domain-containing protein n=1 Tax=Salinispira pacifica TaxID=1307761 RepID=V5WI09_9SPIO|nr:HEAT repeat domain-containing protein [Salinispira pacifica]AHC15179.1 hypothetical protein L21SP2_1802 [Salinispira pacifica]
MDRLKNPEHAFQPLALCMMLISFFWFTSGGAILGQEDAGDAENSSGEEDVQQSLYEKWEETILYGIDSSVVSTIEEMIELEDARLADPVLTLVSSSRQSLRIKALDYFEALERDDAIPAVLDELMFYQDIPRNFTIRLFQHLKERNHPMDKDLWELSSEIIQEEGYEVQLAAIQYTAETEYRPAAEFLAEYYEDPDLEIPVREAILRALGRIQHPGSRDLIFDLAGDESIEKTLRIAAINAAGQYADSRAMNVISNAFSSSDTLIRTAAVAALSSFEPEEVQELYLEALRDSFWRIRMTALRGIEENPFDDAFAPLRYMTQNDPETNIKHQAFRSLASIESRKSRQYLREALEDEELGDQFRQTAAVLLIRNDFPGSKENIERVMAETWDDENNRLLDTICKELSLNKLTAAGSLYERMLGHENYIIQIYGIRGIARNQIASHRDYLEQLSEDEEAHPALRANARNALERL